MDHDDVNSHHHKTASSSRQQQPLQLQVLQRTTAALSERRMNDHLEYDDERHQDSSDMKQCVERWEHNTDDDYCHRRLHHTNDVMMAVAATATTSKDSVTTATTTTMTMPFSYNDVKPLSPRWLYTAVFAWIAVVGGRFLAPMLEQACHRTTTEIGLLLAIQQAVSVLTSATAGAVADRYEQQQQSRHGKGGRVTILAAGIVWGTGIFLLHGMAEWLTQFDQSSTRNAAPTSTKRIMSLFDSLAWYIVLRIAFALAMSMTFPVLDGICLDHLEQQQQHEQPYPQQQIDSGSDSTPIPARQRPGGKERFGQERLYGAISWAVINMIMALFLDLFSFAILYILAVVVTVVTLGIVWIYADRLYQVRRIMQKQHSDLTTSDTSDNQEDEEQPVQDSFDSAKEHRLGSTNKNIISTFSLLRLLFHSSLALSFLIAFVTLSSGQAIVDNLVFLFFEELGSSFVVMGATVTLTVALEVPIFQIAPMLLERVGSPGLLLLAATCYVTRVVGYSLIPTGSIGWLLLLEPLHGVTYACSATASVDFVAQLMPTGYEASGQGLIYLFRGIGSVLGLWLGGWAQESFGPRTMYRLSAGLVFMGSALFGLVLLLRRQAGRTSTLGQHKQIGQHDDDHNEIGEEGKMEMTESAPSMSIVDGSDNNGL